MYPRPMGFIRMVLRYTLGVLWTAACFSVRVLIWPSTWFSGPLDRRMRRAIIRFWGRGFAPIIGMKVVVAGPLPEPPFYLVANHLSYLDVWVLDYTLGCAFVARGDMQHWPIIGPMSKALHVLFIDRENKRDAVRVNELIAHTLQQGDGIAVFAESRISRGLDVEPFKSALIQPAILNSMPVHFATISYESKPGGPPASRTVGWWRPEPFFFHLSRLLRQRHGFTATIVFGEEPIASTDRKLLAQQLYEAVRANYVPMK